MYWLWKEWANLLRLRSDGMPILGFTWYSLTDQVDWDTALREVNGRVVARGLYDLDGRIRPVGLAYQKLIADWRDVLPMHSVCLQLPSCTRSATRTLGQPRVSRQGQPVAATRPSSLATNVRAAEARRACVALSAPRAGRPPPAAAAEPTDGDGRSAIHRARDGTRR